MTDLDTRLRELGELSPPSRSPLGADELHRRATRNRRRALALRAVPAAVVVIVLLAGAVALRARDTASEITVTTPVTTTSTGLGERDQEMIGFLLTAAELRHQLNREAVLTAAFSGSGRTSAVDELAAQRAMTDAALARYRDELASARPGEDAPELAEALKQAENRLDRLETVRESVDRSQTEIYANLDDYRNTVAALADLPLRYLQGVQQPAVFRGVLNAHNYGVVADLDAATSSSLTVAVEVGYYPFTMDLAATGPSVSGSGVTGCRDDAAGAGAACPAYALPLQLQADADQAEHAFQTFATADQKLLARAGEGDGHHDDLKQAAFEDGAGQNDLRGTTPGSRPIDPLDWRAAALDHVDRMADVERQLYELVGTDAVGPDTEPPVAGSADGTAPASPPSSVPEGGPSAPAPGVPDGGVSDRDPVGTTPHRELPTDPGGEPLEPEVVLAPNPTDQP